MRKISVVLVAVMLLSVGNVFANNELPIKKKPVVSLANQIKVLIKDCPVNSTSYADLTALVRLTLNDKKEIVVLTVKTEDKSLAYFIKNKLNYKKVNVENYRKGKIFIVPVRITKR